MLIFLVAAIFSRVVLCQGDIAIWTATLKGPGDHCSPTVEAEFLKLVKAAQDANLEWAEADAKWNDVCNPFKFYRCDPVTERCDCCNNDGNLGWDAVGGKCRVKVNGKCASDGSPDPSYSTPCFDNTRFAPLKAFSPDVAIPALLECKAGKYESVLDKFTGHLLEYGNNDLGNKRLPRQKNGLGQGSPCDIQKEADFHGALRLRAKETDFRWLLEFKTVCNVFKYLRCDGPSGKCICWHPDLFWAPNDEISSTILDQQASLHLFPDIVKYAQLVNQDAEFLDFGRYKGRCRVALNRKDSCTTDLPVHTVLPKYKKPFDLDIFDHLLDPGPDHELKTLDSRHLRCVPNSWNHLGHFECSDDGGQGDEPCKTDQYFLRAEIEILRKRGGRDTDWSFPPNDLCEEVKQSDFLRNGEPFTWDFDKVRDIIIKRETRDYCNPFIYQVCYRGICGCQRPIPKRNLTHGEKGARYVYRNNECIPEEGITCSRRYWYNGNWVDFLDECDASLKCVLAPDGLNHVCCDPDELKVNRIPIENKRKGRCRDMLLGYNTPSGSTRIAELRFTAIAAILIAAHLKSFLTNGAHEIELQ